MEKIEIDGKSYWKIADVDNSCGDHKCSFFKDGDCPDCGSNFFKQMETEELLTKDTNPKDAIGVTKAPLSVLPMQVVYEAALGMYEGALKYGAFNYRIAGVRASVYYDAVQRHMNQWWEGEDIDSDSELSHITKAITTLMVLRDAMLNDKFNDDRPPKVLDQSWMKNYNEKVKQLQAKYPNPVPRYTWKVNQ